MELDQAAYYEALEAEGVELEPWQRELVLATAFQTRTAIGGPFAGTSSAAGRRSHKLTVQDRAKSKAVGSSTGKFEEAKHPRSPTGEFIQSGSTGAAVKSIQGTLGIKEDGEFGKRTTSRIREFQRNHGLQVDGVVGQQTAAALLGNDNAEAIDPGALRPGQAKRLIKSDTSSSSSSGKDKIDVDKDGIGKKIRDAKPFKSSAEDSLPQKSSDRLVEAGWDYSSDGYWYPPGHPKNKK